MKHLIGVACGVLLAGSVTTAGAVPLAGATKVRVTNVLNEYIQIAEVQVMNFADANVALTGTSSSSSSWGGAFSGPAKAHDGNTDGNYYSGSMFHSNQGAGEFWELVIAPTNVKSLTIWGRSDCCRSRDYFEVSVFGASGNLLWQNQFDLRTGDRFATVTFDPVPDDPDPDVPAPGTLALLLGGLGMGALASRRSRARHT